jgi:hypothetical protein
MADPAGFPVSTVGVDFVQSIITLTAGQIAGTDPIVGANPNRRAIKFGGASQTIKISLAPARPMASPMRPASAMGTAAPTARRVRSIWRRAKA